jgi:ribosome-binding protein aMBF1 (putative translation factor)
VPDLIQSQRNGSEFKKGYLMTRATLIYKNVEPSSFGNIVRNIRKQCGYSQADVSARFRGNRASFTNWENKENSTIQGKEFVKLAAALKYKVTITLEPINDQDEVA